MSVDAPVVAIVFGGVTPPQGDVVELRVHWGCTREVSSFEALLQNWGGKYSPNGATPVSVGVDGSISVGRGASCPLLMTCRVESVKYESTPVESYVRVSGRCWGERLFRRVVTKTYENKKGEEIVKDLLDYYVGLSHVRDSTELVEDTDTTYTSLAYENTPVIDVLQYVAESADKAGVIGYDFRVAPDGKFEFFPRNSKTSSVSLSEKIEQSEYGRDIHRVRNCITVYGVADKSVPLDKDSWTESLTPADGAWTSTSGNVSFDSAVKVKGSGSIKTYAQNLNYGGCLFTLDAGKEVDAALFPVLNLWLSRESAFNGNVTLTLFDSADRAAGHEFTVGHEKWFQTQMRVGAANADVWQVESGFVWTQVKKVRVVCWFDGAGTGSFWVDGLFFGGRRYSTVQEDAGSQSGYGLRELVEVDEELWSDGECTSRAKALLASLKDPAEQLTLRSTVMDYGAAPLLAGDKVHVALPNEGVDSDFRILNVEYNVDAKTQTLETALELGREQPLLADYMFRLKSKTDSLSRYKLARA
ncbi:hypothetical protein JXA31_09485 [Candidatus Bathyarchaeota archaeon]|nr:hypothetical protein [Candidatus Bathyarchaeota archaeon]